MAAGRPKKYTKKGLREAIERYFRSISRTIPARDDTGGIIRNDDDEEIKVVQFVVPPSVTGMCLYLGIDRSTWQNYADAALHPELAGICQGVSGAGAADTGEGRAGHHLQPAEQLRLEAEAGGRTGQGHPREHEARRHLP